MSLREKLHKAQEDTFLKRKASDLATIDRTLGDIAHGLPVALEQIIAKAQRGEDPPDTLDYDADCKHIGITDISKADLEAMPGYNALVAACRSPDIDVELHIWTGKQDEQQPITARSEYLAKVEVCIYPSIPYGNNSSLQVQPAVNGPSLRIDITGYIPPAAAPAPAPPEEQAAPDAIAVMAPLKLKG